MVIQVRVENLQEVLQDYRQAVEAAATFADEADAQEAMKRNVRTNFDLLKTGGAAPTWGGGAVSWDTRRSPLTRAERQQIPDVGPDLPILEASGEMRRDYVETPEFSSNAAADRSDAVLRGGSSASRRKARKHHEGGVHTAIFENIGVIEDNFLFPRRPFAFWNDVEPDRIARAAGQAAARRWRS